MRQMKPTMEQKRFDGWQDVDCNECSNYWTDACDGAKKGARTPCNSFIAQRGVIIPEEIKALRSEIKCLRIGSTLTCFLIWLWILGHMTGVW